MARHAQGTTRRTSHAPAPAWEAFQARLIDPTQIAYEEIRPVVALGQDIKARAAEIGVTPKTLSKRVDQFIQHGIPGLIPAATRGPSDGRLLPQPIREYILQLKAEYPAFSAREIAAIVDVQFDRTLDHRTVVRVLEHGPVPTLVGRRYPRYAKLRGVHERRTAILRLHLDGWSVRAIVGYLGAPRRTVYHFLTRWASDAVVRRLGDRKRGRPLGGQKVTLPVVATVRSLQSETAIGEFRMAAALKQQYGIVLSPRTCGRIMAKNRVLYGIGLPQPASEKPKKPMPFATRIPHRWWSVDLCYIERHHLPDVTGPFYVWTILDNASRSIVASAPSKTQSLWDFLLVLFTAIYVHGAPIGLVSDSGGVFKANAAMALYQRLGIEKRQIARGKPWQNYCETNFRIMKLMEAYRLGEATTWEEVCAIHARYIGDFNHQEHLAHRQREDGSRTPAEVLGGAQGRLVAVPTLQEVFELLMAQRTVRPTGYIRYHNWRIYGQEGLDRTPVGVWLAKETLTLAHVATGGEIRLLAQYHTVAQPHERRRQHFSAIQEAYIFPPPTAAPQAPLWDDDTLLGVEWRKAYRLPPYRPRRELRRADAVQTALFA